MEFQARIPELVAGNVEEDVAAWVAGQTAAECDRLKRGGVERVLPLSCSAFCTQDSGAHVWNHVEVLSSFNFDRIRQILVSDPTLCPMKDNFSHVHVVLQTDTQELSTLCILVPYIFDRRNKRNTLKNWAFVNSAGKESRHRVDAFS
jgi:hypothetical protein